MERTQQRINLSQLKSVMTISASYTYLIIFIYLCHEYKSHLFTQQLYLMRLDNFIILILNTHFLDC